MSALVGGKARRARIIELWKQGLTAAAIRERTGASAHTISQVLSREKLSSRDAPRKFAPGLPAAADGGVSHTQAHRDPDMFE